ncbi:angio-associated migratory cell protein [Macrosteles quadrilineatus]|uniref:angio-associated migratory cell protein n=1 Tax=Macrosteles quadrilineatus TaxID=74068 RepID=UPI0023E27753|nr:angio-associated migratory cell protein [Macrosteles quadrilineatus]
MIENDSDIGEDEMEEIDEDDIEEVLDNIVGEGEESEEEDQNDERDEGPGSPERDDADFVFQKHTGPVFCCALEPKNGNLAVTGGQDDMAYVWEIHNGQILFECSGHKDSVSMAAFSYDGSYVATGDMSGLIQVWKVATHALVWSDTVGDLSWMQWHHGTSALVAAVTTGEVYMWRIPGGECKVIPGHAANSDCGVIMPDGRRVSVGYSDGAVKVFELKTGAVQGSSAVGEAHSLSVLCIEAFSDNNIIATGGADGKINLFKTQPSLKSVWSLSCGEQDDSNTCIETIKFSRDPTLPLLAAGTLIGILYILDFTKQTVRHKIQQDCGVCRLVWDCHSPVVFAAGLEGVIRIYDARNGAKHGQLMGHRESILDIDLSTDGNTLVSASDDSTCRVYAVSPPER